MPSIESITVFCGSSLGQSEHYQQQAVALAESLCQRDISLVYGGASVGLMGVMANKVLELGGDVVGVIPQSLVDCEVAHKELSQIHVVDSMARRKQVMADLADAFIMLPGGIGSLDEFFEMMTWAQLGFQDKPLGILNVDGYYDHLLAFLDHAVAQGFVLAQHREMLIVTDSVDELVEGFTSYQAPGSKWLDDFIAENSV